MATTTNTRELWPAAGDWLRDRRESAHLSQRELGRLIGASYQSVSNYERGISAPADTTCERIAMLFHVDAAEVRDRWGKYNPPGAQRFVPAPPPLALEDAIRADTRLLPEAKQHLIAQVGLLLRIQGDRPESADHTRARDDLRRARAVDQSSQDCDTPNGT